MGNSSCVHQGGDDAMFQPKRASPAVVSLSLYSFGPLGQVANTLLRPLGTGAYHCGVEVYDCEWSFGNIFMAGGGKMPDEFTGIFTCMPQACDGHTFYKSVPMGHTYVSQQGVMVLIHAMEASWKSCCYDVVTRNCCHFCNEFCRRLGVGPIPPWLLNLANAGAAMKTAGTAVCCRAPASALGSVTAVCSEPALRCLQQGQAWEVQHSSAQDCEPELV
mmetsp:Transcript_100652/g.290777  ORF Transcript_100652/g.290777 Transcript_100652/m.290777 type:complete len:218 (-) Transcript_100652:91-744(-)